MNRKAFYSHLRRRDNDLFGARLSQRQVDGIEALLDALAGFPLAHAAHVLAEVYHETGAGMYPVKETVFSHSKDKNPSDDVVKARLERAWKAGQLPWVRTPYWRDGWFGRGQIQITHEDNYRRAGAMIGRDLVADPNLALELRISAAIAARGCQTGLFTGQRLSDFDGPGGFDHHGARAIVNGDKNAVGPRMQRYGATFERALKAGHWSTAGFVRPDAPSVQPAPRRRRSLWERLRGMF